MKKTIGILFSILCISTNAYASSNSSSYEMLYKQGQEIFMNTPKYASRYVGNNLSCASCHLDGGNQKNAMPMWGAYPMYPEYIEKNNSVVTFAQRLQNCFIFSENGNAPSLNSQTILALTVYAKELSKNQKIGQYPKGAGLLPLGENSRDADMIAGANIYKQNCAMCHKADGGGNIQNKIPPLWGLSSYNKGAGMANYQIAARFIYANMPPVGQKLTTQEALDVAKYIDMQFRKPDPRKGVLGWIK